MIPFESKTAANLIENRHSNPDLKNIADAFSRAAHSYDQHAEFQREVGRRLLQQMPENLTGKRVLDLGCGTGYFSEQIALRGAQVVALDISPAMLEQCQLRCAEYDVHYVLADAQALPFEDAQFDWVFSSLALQWCQDWGAVLKQLKQIIKPKGKFVFSTLLEGSLHELDQAWKKVDGHQHVNTFHSLNQINLALAQSECIHHQLKWCEIKQWYTSAFELMKDLKGIGATYVVGRSAGLTHRRSLLAVEHEYQQFADSTGRLPASYQVCLGRILI